MHICICMGYMHICTHMNRGCIFEGNLCIYMYRGCVYEGIYMDMYVLYGVWKPMGWTKSCVIYLSERFPGEI